MREPLCVAILTLDEAVNIRKAITSIGGRVPVIVVDSESSDATVEIARALGAEVHIRKFDNYASQRNHAIDLVRDRFDWVFFLDADEAVDKDVWGEIETTITRAEIVGAYVGLRVRILGYEFKHGGAGNYLALRLLRTDRLRFIRSINERVDDQGLPTIRLRNKLVHEDLRPLAQLFQKHIRYAQREAAVYLDGEDRARGLQGFGLRTRGARVIGMRWVYQRLPLFVRPFVRFGKTMVLHSAWRDGIPGIMLAAMQSLWYPMMIDLFIHEAKRLRKRQAATR
jgi:glycosyltransferase involved in cell wall biosynthesis